MFSSEIHRDDLASNIAANPQAKVEDKQQVEYTTLAEKVSCNSNACTTSKVRLSPQNRESGMNKHAVLGPRDRMKHAADSKVSFVGDCEENACFPSNNIKISSAGGRPVGANLSRSQVCKISTSLLAGNQSVDASSSLLKDDSDLHSMLAGIKSSDPSSLLP